MNNKQHEWAMWVGLRGIGMAYIGTHVGTEEKATEIAKQYAYEEYFAHEGKAGFLSWHDCREEMMLFGDHEPSDDEVDEYYHGCIDQYILIDVHKFE